MANELNKKQKEVVEQMTRILPTAPWILRISEQKDYTGPVMTICERISTLPTEMTAAPGQAAAAVQSSRYTRLKEWGMIFNGNLRACLPAIQDMMSAVTDDRGVELNVQILLDGTIRYRGHIPIDEETGCRLALLFRLQGLVRDRNRAELMAWRISRFSREETLYWFAKTSSSAYGKSSIEWAKSGLRVMLAGQQTNPKEVQRLLEQLRK